MKPQGVSRLARDQAHPTICMSTMPLSTWHLMHPHVPLCPRFWVQTQVQELELGHMGDYFAEYQAYGQEFRDAFSFRDFVQLQRDSRPRDHHRGHQHYHEGDTQRTVSRFHLPTFDGSSNSSKQAWVEKLDIYLHLN